MAKVNVVGDAVVFTSSLKFADIQNLEKYRPDALTLKGGEDGKEPIFRIGTTDSSGGSIGKYGAEFAGETRDEGKFATITLLIENEVDDIKELIADEFGGALMHLKELEEILPSVITEIAEQRAAVMENIEVA